MSRHLSVSYRGIACFIGRNGTLRLMCKRTALIQIEAIDVML